jgi:hypothetical protein
MYILEALYRMFQFEFLRGCLQILINPQLWRQQLEDLQVLWFFRWIEEIFADVYGCLIAGPLIALDFQDLQLTVSKEQFTKDDGEHPAPVLRPYIYTRVLERLEEDGLLPLSGVPEEERLQSWSGNLEARWNGRRPERRDERNVLDEFALDEPTMPSGRISNIISFLWNYHRFEVRDARKQVDKIADAIYDLLRDNNLVSSWWWSAFSGLAPIEIEGLYPNEGELENLDAELENLYKQFEGYLRNQDSLGRLEFSDELGLCEDLKPYENWNSWKDDVLESPRVYLRTLLEDLRAKIFEVEPDPPWVYVLDAEGWATKGPCGRGD